MDRDVAERVGSGVAVVLALGLGLVLGGRYCAVTPPMPLEEPPACEEVQPCPTCPSCDVTSVPADVPVKASVTVAERPKETVGRQLPRAPQVSDPVERRRLLTWVRDQSDVLSACRPKMGDVLRVNVVFDLSESGRILRAHLQAGQGEIPVPVANCLKEAMLRWEPPAEFVKDRERLMFSLTI